MELRLRKIQLHERKNVELRLEGMRHVRDNYGTTKEQDALVTQIKLCNEIIDDIKTSTGEKDFED